MFTWRNIFLFVTALSVWGGALVCACPGPVAGLHESPSAVALTHDGGCHDQPATPDEPSDGQEHGPGCECLGAALAPEAKPIRSAFALPDSGAGFLPILQTWQAPMMHATPTLSCVWQGRVGRSPGDSGTLLRLHCALIL